LPNQGSSVLGIGDKIAPVKENSYCFVDEIYMGKINANAKLKNNPPVLSGGLSYRGKF